MHETEYYNMTIISYKYLSTITIHLPISVLAIM